MTNKEKAQLTYKAIRKKKIAKARAITKEADQYSITNTDKIKRRNR